MKKRLEQLKELLKEIAEESKKEGNDPILFFLVAADMSTDEIEINGGGDHESLIDLLINARQNEFVDGILTCVENGGCVKAEDLASSDIAKIFLNKKPTAQA